ncbi:hypothetical protein JYT44_00265, partial [Caldithrix abyssi]|nr:hypothetical protein [Caldithrix abyssi]
LLLDMVKINYQDEIPTINFFSSMLSAEYRDDIITLLSTKSSHWQYEDEYRLTLWERINHGLIFPKILIKQIYLGCNISEDNRNSILRILGKNDMETEVYQSLTSDKRFELTFTQIR